ncbi:acyltransferase family protein [Rothia sp. 11254D007CT]
MNRTSHRHKPLGSFIEQPKFRPEVQGLRSLAVLLVVMYHVWFGKVSGGVDVFLFISAFLLSLSSLRKIQDGKPLKVVSYWLHVFQRLLPAAATVIAATLVAAYFIIAPSRWASLLADAKAALFYFLNWRLAFNSVDYYAQDATLKTPFQHFWSLSMQGQIFIIWPLLFAFVAFLVGYLRLKVLPTALFVFGTVFVTSLTFSVIETSTNQSFAYFDTRTRLWEFAAGTLLAMLVLAWRVPSWLKVPMGWLGVIGLVTCGWLLPVERAFPGYLALWPLLSGAFVIAAGQTGSRLGADRLLSAKPLQKMGAISYCLYLVHWPILILYTTAIGEPKAGWLDGTLVILSSIAVAWLLHNVVEKPLRAWEKKPSRRALRHAKRSEAPWNRKKQDARGSWVRPVAVIAVCFTLVGGLDVGATRWLNAQTTVWEYNASLAGTPQFPGALAIGETKRYQNPPIPVIRDQGWVDTSNGEQCNSYPGMENSSLHNPEAEEYCYVMQTKRSPDAPTFVFAGDSHSQQSLSLFEEVIPDDATVILMIKPWCRLTISEESYSTAGPTADAACQSYNARALEEIQQLKPTYLALISTRPQDGIPDERLVNGIDAVANLAESYGGKIISVRDNPRFAQNMFECSQRENTSSCSVPRSQVLASMDPAQPVLDRFSNVYEVDLSNYYCPEGYCVPVIGNVALYMDNNHITAQYGKTLSGAVMQQLEVQGWDPSAPNPTDE